MTKFLLMTLIVPLLISCSKTDSSNVKTEGIYPTFIASANSTNEINIQATFQVGGSTGTFLNLSDGDAITVNGLTMTRSEFAGIISYYRSIAYTEGASFTFVFNRPNEGNYTSTVTLPNTFSITSPTANSTQTKGASLALTWTGAGANDTMKIDLSKTYGTTTSPQTKTVYGESTFSAGTYTFTAAETDVSEATVDLNSTITVNRIGNGTLATGFQGGIIQGKQKRQVDFTLH